MILQQLGKFQNSLHLALVVSREYLIYLSICKYIVFENYICTSLPTSSPMYFVILGRLLVWLIPYVSFCNAH